jgi:hypothetical protein
MTQLDPTITEITAAACWVAVATGPAPANG